MYFPIPNRLEMLFWTRVAERIIDLITAYTGEGVMFAVDTRLRPNGREGELVQQVCAYKDYLAHRAEAWEGITYMKSRAVVGNCERPRTSCTRLQEVDWRRYGQSGRSRTRSAQHARRASRRSKGRSNPLKAGPGGYYDIDFALMYLRLKSAGIFFKVLNTPERIDVIEKMGHLEARAMPSSCRRGHVLPRHRSRPARLLRARRRQTAEFEAHLEVLTNLVYRWTPESLQDQPLPVEIGRNPTPDAGIFQASFRLILLNIVPTLFARAAFVAVFCLHVVCGRSGDRSRVHAPLQFRFPWCASCD